MRYRILISDDEVDIVEMLTGFFRSKGYEVFSAYNGVETLKLAELQPDIILLDINMPKLDGIEVCKKIRDYVSCPILFLTARIEENDKVQGFSVGGDDYIVKPFSLVELEARVQAHLRREERHQTNTKVKFSGELLIDYSERNVYIQNQTSVYKGYKQDKIEMRGDRAEMSDFPLYLNTVAGGLDRRDQTIGGFSFVVKIYAVPVVEIIG